MTLIEKRERKICGSFETVTRTCEILANFSVTYLRFCSARSCAWHLWYRFTFSLSSSACLVMPEELRTESCGFFHLRVSTSQTYIPTYSFLPKICLHFVSLQWCIFLPKNYYVSFSAKDCFSHHISKQVKSTKTILDVGCLNSLHICARLTGLTGSIKIFVLYFCFGILNLGSDIVLYKYLYYRIWTT